MSQTTNGCACVPQIPEDGHSDCACLSDPRDIIDLKTYLYQACGGRLYRLLLLTTASAVLMGDGSSVETRMNTIERNLAMNTTMRFADSIAHRDALTGWTPGDVCYVKDASADPQVSKGAALYVWLPELKWAKVWAMLDALNIIKKNGGLMVDEETGRVMLALASGGALSINSKGLLDFDLAQVPTAQRTAFMALLGAQLAGSGLKWADSKLNVDVSRMDAAALTDFIKAISAKLTGAGLAANAATGVISIDGASLAGSGLKWKGNKFVVDLSSMPASDSVIFIKDIASGIAGSGLVVNPSTGQISIDTAQLAGSGLSAGANGSLGIDGAALAGAGLAFENGKFKVDFSSNNAETEKMINSVTSKLHIPKWLQGNTTFYVDASKNAAPTDVVTLLNEGWGLSAAKAFKSLQECVNFVADNFNIGPYTVTISVAPGTYTGIELPEFSRTKGRIDIVGSNAGTPFTMTGSGSGAAVPRGVNALGGEWSVSNFILNYNMTFNTETYPTSALAIVDVSPNAILHLRDHQINTSFAGKPGTDYGFNAYVVAGGILYFELGNIGASSYSHTRRSGNNSSGRVFHSYSGGWIYFNGTNSASFPDNSDREKFYLTGEMAYIASVSNGHITVLNTRRHYLKCAADGTLTGKPYILTNGGNISAGASFFPGVGEGENNDNTGCWYK